MIKIGDTEITEIPGVSKVYVGNAQVWPNQLKKPTITIHGYRLDPEWDEYESAMYSTDGGRSYHATGSETTYEHEIGITIQVSAGLYEYGEAMPRSTDRYLNGEPYSSNTITLQANTHYDMRAVAPESSENHKLYITTSSIEE